MKSLVMGGQNSLLQRLSSSWKIGESITGCRLSVGFPHSNCRAEVGVKTVKRLITGNTGPSGSLDVDKFAMAMPGKYKPHPTWQETLSAREEALRNRNTMAAERWSEHTRQLPQLKVGDTVRIQNQTGNYLRRWDKTGRIVDGSGRATLRNRRFLRQYTPYVPRNFRRICNNTSLRLT